MLQDLWCQSPAAPAPIINRLTSCSRPCERPIGVDKENRWPAGFRPTQWHRALRGEGLLNGPTAPARAIWSWWIYSRVIRGQFVFEIRRLNTTLRGSVFALSFFTRARILVLYWSRQPRKQKWWLMSDRGDIRWRGIKDPGNGFRAQTKVDHMVWYGSLCNSPHPGLDCWAMWSGSCGEGAPPGAVTPKSKWWVSSVCVKSEEFLKNLIL